MNDATDLDGPWHDSIVDDVRAVRAALFAASGSDIRTFCRGLREEQGRSGHLVITRAADADGLSSEPLPPSAGVLGPGGAAEPAR